MISSVDPLQVDRRRAEVRVAELALDDVERQALAGQLEGRRERAHGALQSGEPQASSGTRSDAVGRRRRVARPSGALA
jgi:hypothetical protein